MLQMRLLAATGVCGALLAGCSGALNDARKMTPAGSEFARELYKGYVKLAEMELDETDFQDTYLYALRARSAAMGNPEPLESVGLRNLPEQRRDEIVRARSRLVAAFEAGAKTRKPGEAANAQIMFECWLQEQEENIQPKDIAACRKGFETAIGSLETELVPKKAALEIEPTLSLATAAAEKAPDAGIVKASVESNPKPPTKTRFTVLFGFGAAEIRETARRVIEQAAAAARLIGATVIKVSGHTDRAGTDAYNVALSDRRAKAVADALSGTDGARQKIEIEALGETRPAVATPDGVKEPRNRRVEIELIN